MTTAIVVIPAFQLGTLGIFLRGEFGIDESILGGVVAMFFLSSAITAPFSGRLADQIGAKRSLILGMLGSTTTLAGIAVSTELWHLLVLVAVGGVANGLVQPAANLALSGSGQSLRGLMFGVKQSGVPIATLAVGVMVPAIALTYGWRWAFASSALLAVLSILLLASTRFESVRILSPSETRHRPQVRTLIPLAVAACLGIAAATSLGAFAVESAVSRGIGVGLAGWLLAIGSVAGIVARLTVGYAADRSRANPIKLMSLMLGIGVVGYVTLVFSTVPAFILLGVVIAFAFGWGWNGLLMYSVVLLQPRAPAAASGIAQVGMSTGAAIGPLVFGAIVSGGGYTWAWSAVAVSAALASVLMIRVARGAKLDNDA